MTTPVIALADAAGASVDRVGVKAHRLARLLAAGFAVPGGFVVTAPVLRRGVEASGSEGSALSAEVGSAIAEAVGLLGDSRFAVRSSATVEDLAGVSFAGQYETRLDVTGAELVSAVCECWRSLTSDRSTAYRSAHGLSDAGEMAVLVQRMVPATVAGVATTASPTTGEPVASVVAVPGTAEALMSEGTAGEEWAIHDGEAQRREGPITVLAASDVLRIGKLARDVAECFGCPQEIEWAMAEGELFLLQARPLAPLPADVSWASPRPGGWMRTYRLGEWIGAPVTPLFESWLLPRLWRGASRFRHRAVGIGYPEPGHVIVHGWYFGSLNYVPRSLLEAAGMILRVLAHFVRHPRRGGAMLFGDAGLAAARLFIREWRDELLPRYRSTVDRVGDRVGKEDPAGLIAAVDTLAELAGEYYGYMAAVAGAAWQWELMLAQFCHEHADSSLPEGHGTLLRSSRHPLADASWDHTVFDLDWVHRTRGEMTRASPDLPSEEVRARFDRERHEAEARVIAVLLPSRRRVERFRRLLEEARRLAPLREESLHWFTLGWPAMRAALNRLGDLLESSGQLARCDDVFFLTETELRASIAAGVELPPPRVLAARRAERIDHARLMPPPLVGEAPPAFDRALALVDTLRSRPVSSRPGVLRGHPAGMGRATGPVRVVRSPADLSAVRAGDVMVVPALATAWLPVATRVAGVVSGSGTALAHAALVLREYGVPCVVGVPDAMVELRDGVIATVDGSAGVVEVEVATR
jgi:phosphohistidine swiveling domain-containing protein